MAGPVGKSCLLPIKGVGVQVWVPADVGSTSIGGVIIYCARDCRAGSSLSTSFSKCVGWLYLSFPFRSSAIRKRLGTKRQKRGTSPGTMPHGH